MRKVLACTLGATFGALVGLVALSDLFDRDIIGGVADLLLLPGFIVTEMMGGPGPHTGIRFPKIHVVTNAVFYAVVLLVIRWLYLAFMNRGSRRTMLAACAIGSTFGTLVGLFAAYNLFGRDIAGIAGLFGFPGYIATITIWNLPFDSVKFYPRTYVVLNSAFYAIAFLVIHLLYLSLLKWRRTKTSLEKIE